MSSEQEPVQKKKKKSQKMKQCRFCGKMFTQGQALGGHTSRAHPGMVAQHKTEYVRNY